ncbi:MAG: CRISPR-associated endonuclease Cas2 [Spirochaetia bacterium]|nr:CRISPR-associated endonuclease Cas2 [Spirochaetia bacterium]
MSREQIRLVVYDIRDARRLRQVAEIAGSYGCRIQKSVFIVNGNEEIIEKLLQKCRRVIQEDDSVLTVPLCGKDWKNCEFYGIRQREEFEETTFLIL